MGKFTHLALQESLQWMWSPAESSHLKSIAATLSTDPSSRSGLETPAFAHNYLLVPRGRGAFGSPRLTPTPPLPQDEPQDDDDMAEDGEIVDEAPLMPTQLTPVVGPRR